MNAPESSLNDPRWTALSNTRREELLTEYRDVNVDHFDWWDTTEEDFKSDMSETQGITVEKTFFSGFWSQGDGSCFEGYVEDWDKVLERTGYPQWKRWAKEYGWTFSCTHKGHYYHEHSMNFSGGMQRPENPFDEDEQILQHDAWEISNDVPTETQLNQFWAELSNHFRDLAAKYYRNLEAEHEYLTSDEVVVQYILDNQEEELVETEDEEALDEI